jgi:ATP-dependent Clp protease ATP-binding subunit ClpA
MARLAPTDRAATAGHDYMGTEHLVLSVLAEPQALAARGLAEQNVTAEQLRAAMKVVLGPRQDSMQHA